MDDCLYILNPTRIKKAHTSRTSLPLKRLQPKKANEKKAHRRIFNYVDFLEENLFVVVIYYGDIHPLIKI